MNVEFDKKSLRKLQKQLGEVLKKDKEATFQGMVKTGYEIHAEAVNKCPVDMSRLRTSIAVESNKRKMEVRVGTNVKYAPFVEFGTRPHTPPFNKIEEWANRKGAPAGAIWTAIRKYGTKPHPFLRPAFESNIGHLISNIKRLIKR